MVRDAWGWRDMGGMGWPEKACFTGGTSGGASILYMVLPYAHLCRETRFADYAETSMFTNCFASLLLRA